MLLEEKKKREEDDDEDDDNKKKKPCFLFEKKIPISKPNKIEIYSKKKIFFFYVC